MASYTLIQLKKFAARLRGEGFSLQRGEAKKLGSRKNDISLICFAAKIASGGAVNTKTFCVRALRPSPPPLAFTDAVTNITFHDIFCLKRDKPPQHCASSQCEHRRQQWVASDLSHHDSHPFYLLPATDATRVYRWMASPPGNAGFSRAPTFSKANLRI